MRTVLMSFVVGLTLVGSSASAQTGQGAAAALKRAAPIFSFETDDFWVNLHQFLYVLGRAQANQPDASRPAAAEAVPDMQRGLPMLSAEERAVWSTAVTTYAMRWSVANPDGGAIRLLINMSDVPTLMASQGLDPLLRDAVDRVAPIYRRVWWPSHQEANRKWAAQTAALVARHGEAMLGFLTRAYAMQWPTDGRTVTVSAYANFGGAFSLINGRVLVVSSVAPDNQGLSAIESIFHESLHQWDNETFDALRTPAKAANVMIPQDLPHAMIFFTAGEAVKRVVPDYTPYADRAGIWELAISGATRPAGRLRQPLIDAWKPWLDGRVTREDALKDLVVQAAAATR
jgi:hypothetical protein